MIYEITSISLILIEGILIIISLRSVCNINKVSREFAEIFGSSKEEISGLFEKLKELIEIGSKREHYMQHVTFHLNELEMYIKMILKEIKLLKLDTEIDK